MSAPSLLEVQRWMRSRIRAGAPSPSEAPLLHPQGGASGEERMAVYADGYDARLQESLATTYAAVHQVLGRAAFAALAQAYAERHPSHEYNLNLVGRHLPAFLRSYALTTSLPFLPGLARLEWCVSIAFHAFDETPLHPQHLIARPPETWETLRLHLQPSVGVVASAWPILDLWEARRRPREAIDIDLVDRPQQVLISREGFEVRCTAMDRWQHALLERLLAGQSLGEVCGALAAEAPEGALQPERWCADWMRQGLIVACA